MRDVQHARGSSLARSFEIPEFGVPEYRHTERVAAVELARDQRAIVNRFVMPLFDVISRSGYDPFNDR
jgi:hypothetical protein